MQLTNTFTEVIISSVPSTLKNNGSTDIEIAFSKDVPTKGDYSLAPNQYFNVEDSSLKLWVRAKVTTGECKLLNFRHLEPIPPMFLGSQPHPSLVLGVESTPNGLFIYNRFDDKMPLSISGGKKLEECLVEETEDYKIYADGGTQIRMGRTGLAQKYIEALNTIYSEEIEKGSNILSPKHLTSEVQFHSDLLDILNDEHNKEIEAAYEAQLKVRNTLTDEPYLEPLSEQRVFVAINFACRIDKKSGEIYIGEGYENLFTGTLSINDGYKVLELIETENDFVYTVENTRGDVNSIFSIFTKDVSFSGETFVYSQAYGILSNENKENILISNSYDSKIDITPNSDKTLDNIIKRSTSNISVRFGNANKTLGNVTKFIISKKIFLRKAKNLTDKKPFVKSIMPSGKLAFVTNATSETHSFVMKENKHTNEEFYSSFYIKGYTSNFNHIRSTTKLNNTGDFLVSNKYKQLISDIGNFSLVEANINFDSGVLNFAYINPVTESFKQLLIYKGNLTEEELKAENNKGFRLNPNLYLYPDNVLGEIFTRVA